MHWLDKITDKFSQQIANSTSRPYPGMDLKSVPFRNGDPGRVELGAG